MELSRGKIKSGQKVVLYGPEGIGKTTLASKFPEPVFIDVEGGSNHLDVLRVPKVSSWSALKQTIGALRRDPQGCKTLVLDSIDWAERLATEAIIASDPSGKATSIESFPYGKGIVMLGEEIGKLLNYLSDMASEGWHIVILAHAAMRKQELPDEIGAFDRWELKLAKKTSPLVKEWADAVLFANYKTMVIEVDGKKKAQGGQRVMFTSHHACWDAKNRWGLPDEVKMEWAAIASHVPTDAKSEKTPEAPKREPEPEDDVPMDYEAREREAIDNPETTEPQPTGTRIPYDNPGGFPVKLMELMQEDGITQAQVRKAVAARGYYPEDTPIDRYDDGFVEGVLVANWQKVKQLISTL